MAIISYSFHINAGAMVVMSVIEREDGASQLDEFNCRSRMLIALFQDLIN